MSTTIKHGADFTGYLMFRDRKCGASLRVWVGKDYFANGYRPDGADASIETVPARTHEGMVLRQEYQRVQCPGCGGWWQLAVGQAIYGRFVKEVVCNGKCMGATGDSCDCSCGGENHGANHGRILTAA